MCIDRCQKKYPCFRVHDRTSGGKISKIKQYWEPRWALYYATKGGGHGRVDHRIVKAALSGSAASGCGWPAIGPFSFSSAPPLWRL